MFIVELMYALIIGLAIAWIFGFALNTRGPWNSFLWFFVIIFMFSWGGGVWITPFGPTGWGVAWLPFLFVGIFISLLLSAATPRSARRRIGPKGQATPVGTLKEQTAGERDVEYALDYLFWLLVFGLAVFICWHYAGHHHSF
jgi:hypothetical protein